MKVKIKNDELMSDIVGEIKKDGINIEYGF